MAWNLNLTGEGDRDRRRPRQRLSCTVKKDHEERGLQEGDVVDRNAAKAADPRAVWDKGY